MPPASVPLTARHAARPAPSAIPGGRPAPPSVSGQLTGQPRITSGGHQRAAAAVGASEDTNGYPHLRVAPGDSARPVLTAPVSAVPAQFATRQRCSGPVCDPSALFRPCLRPSERARPVPSRQNRLQRRQASRRARTVGNRAGTALTAVAYRRMYRAFRACPVPLDSGRPCRAANRRKKRDQRRR